MKPNFALNLSLDGVQLLHRGTNGWHVLGAVRFDQTDLDASMAALLKAAEECAPEGVFSKLVMPETEVRYATVLAPGPTDEARRLQIEAEIDGLTPYGVDELAYDHVVEGDHALVAMAAREIMAEAEAFAVNHGFRPVSFVARPVDGSFAGEPFLGLADAAADLIPAHDRVERDAEPIRLAGDRRREPPAPSAPNALAPETRAPETRAPETRAPKSDQGRVDSAAATRAAPASAPPAAPTATRSAAPSRAAGPVGPATAKPPARPRVEITPANPKPASQPGTPLFEAAGGVGRISGLVRRMGNRLRKERLQDAEPGAEKAAGAGAEADTVAGRAPTARPAADAMTTPAPAGGRRGRTAARAATASGKPAAETSAQKPAEARQAPSDTDGESADKASAPVTFSSRRRNAAPAVAAPPVAAGTAAPASAGATGTQGPGGRLAILPGAGASGASLSPLTAVVASVKAQVGKVAQRSKKAVAGPRDLSLFPARGDDPAAASGSPAPGSLRGPALGAIARAPEPIVPESRPPADQAAKASEAEALTIFGARGSGVSTRTGPQRGLMVAGGALLLLVAAGIWALYFAGTSPREPDIAALPPDGVVESDGAAGTGAEPGIQAPEPLPAPGTDAATGTVADSGTGAEAAADDAADTGTSLAGDAVDPAPGVDQTDPAALLERLVEDGLREVAPAELLGDAGPVAGSDGTGPAETGPPDMASPSPAVAAAEGAETEPSTGAAEGMAGRAVTLGFPAPVAMPTIEVAPLAGVAPPPPFGVTFDLGEDGLVEATPEGALTPGGITVFSGQPDAVPPARPGGIAPPAPEPDPEAEAEAPPAAEPAAEPAAMAEPDDTPRADPALADFRPEPRSARVQAIGEELARERAAQQEETPAADETPSETPTEAPTETPTETPAEAPAEPPADGADAGGTEAVVSPGGVSLAALRPQRRPTDMVPPVAEADPTPAAAAPSVAEDEDALPEAVARSLVPSTRPANMAERVAEALAAARRTPEPTPAAAAPSAGPRIPTRASVAEQATQRGLNLRRINLIGVHGTPSDRRAMVRLADGRVVRVGVGDRLDGGQVAAIGDSELRYVRNGRNQVLRIGG